jgi:hypothetical protein
LEFVEFGKEPIEVFSKTQNNYLYLLGTKKLAVFESYAKTKY